MELEKLVSVPEAAKLLKVSPYTVRGWLRDKKLPRTRAGGRVLITRSAIEAFVTLSTGSDRSEEVAA